MSLPPFAGRVLLRSRGVAREATTGSTTQTDLTITVTLAHHHEIKRGTRHGIIEAAGLTREQFLNLL